MMKEYWNRFLHWSGWKKIFPFPVWADVLLFVAFGTGLIWVFVNGLEMWWPSYVLYAFSAYSLAAICLKLPGAVRQEKNWMENHPRVKKLLEDKELHFKLELSQAIFAIFSLQAGLLHTFGTGENWEHPLNLAVGCTVCLLTVAMGIYMIRRANREMNQLQERNYGQSEFL